MAKAPARTKWIDCQFGLSWTRTCRKTTTARTFLCRVEISQATTNCHCEREWIAGLKRMACGDLAPRLSLPRSLLPSRASDPA